MYSEGDQKLAREEKCFICGRKDHWENKCPGKKKRRIKSKVMELFNSSHNPYEWDLVSESNYEFEYFYVNIDFDSDIENAFQKNSVTDDAKSEGDCTYLSDFLMFSFNKTQQQIASLHRHMDSHNASLVIPRRRIQEKIDALTMES